MSHRGLPSFCSARQDQLSGQTSSQYWTFRCGPPNTNFCNQILEFAKKIPIKVPRQIETDIRADMVQKYDVQEIGMIMRM